MTDISSKCGRKERRVIKWEKLVSGEMLSLVLPQYQMKLQTKLASTSDQFDLFLNGESIMTLDRYIKEEIVEEDD